jgi:hypothetical protein
MIMQNKAVVDKNTIREIVNEEIRQGWISPVGCVQSALGGGVNATKL